MFDDGYGLLDEEDETTPVENVALTNTYRKLFAILESPTSDTTVRNGAGERYNGYIAELIGLTGDASLSDFKVDIKSANHETFARTSEYQSQLSSLVRYLHSTNATINYYCTPPPMPAKSGRNNGPTTVNNLHAEQKSEQTTTITLEFTQMIINVTESLTKFEAQNPDINSKENKFAKAFKKGLPAVKSTVEILSLALKVGAQLGIDPQTILKALNLS